MTSPCQKWQGDIVFFIVYHKIVYMNDSDILSSEVSVVMTAICFTVLLHICAALICISFLACYFRVMLVETMPVLVCMLVLILYALAMIHRLSWIDGLAAVVAAAFVAWIAGRPGEVRKNFATECRDKVTQVSFIAAAMLLLVITVCTMGKVVTWWDDINFWAADVKSLYYLDGFAGKYENVAPEFGDYPPAGQLFKWLFLHFDPHMFREGLAFVGYYTMNISFLLPLLRKIKGRNVPMLFLVAAALWFLPSIAEVYGYEGFCADLTMACIYGSFLFAVTDRETPSALFYYGRLALYLGVLVLVKSIGFVWALFGIIFFVLYQFCEYREGGPLSDGWKRRTISVAVLPILTGSSWMLFCLLMRRVTKTTATAVKYMTTDEYGISGYTGEFARAFIRAFIGSPLHKDKSLVIDLTPLGFYLCICLIVVLFYKLHVLPKRTGKLILWFSVISGALFYLIIFLAHITIFATETQYLEVSGMISSIERYGAPFTIGTIVFLMGIWTDGSEHIFAERKVPGFMHRYGTYLCLILFVALTAGYRAGYDGLIGYHNDTADELVKRADMIGEDEAQFLETISVLGREQGARVCYIRRGDVPRWVNNSYTAYEASPISVVYKSVNLDDAPTDWMTEEIRSSHATYLYAEETDADAGAVFDEITQTGTFSCGVLYRISDDGTEMKLTPVS